MTRAWLGALLVLFGVFAAPARADERILGYDSLITIQADGSVLVTENITVRAEGTQIRRGLYRDFPTRYKDRFGNRVRVELDAFDARAASGKTTRVHADAAVSVNNTIAFAAQADDGWKVAVVAGPIMLAACAIVPRLLPDGPSPLPPAPSRVGPEAQLSLPIQ